MGLWRCAQRTFTTADGQSEQRVMKEKLTSTMKETGFPEQYRLTKNREGNGNFFLSLEKGFDGRRSRYPATASTLMKIMGDFLQLLGELIRRRDGCRSSTVVAVSHEFWVCGGRIWY
jgi:hypothetical protein